MARWPELMQAVILSLLFTIALLYATLEVPRLIHGILLNHIPDYGFGNWQPARETLNYLRPIGYVSLLAVIGLIVTGFIIKRSGFALLGSVAFHLPTFGHFAFTMFFLAGIGSLRLLWIPLLDISPVILKLGHIALLPYLLIALPASLIMKELMSTIHLSLLEGPAALISLMFMFAGLLIFTLSTATWLYGRFKGHKLIDYWIYKMSRHPQYLGFILWSYGLLLTTIWLGAQAPRGGYVPTPTLPWLISTLLIITVALWEETVMIKKHGKEYLRYRESTPFMIPLPKTLASLLRRIVKVLLRKTYPENLKEILCLMGLCAATLILLSIPLALTLS
ncbi:MAG: hypothetical protein DRN06_02655 [Thermoprotei archaeon]|nr:MAG: hypothetical protein DRN06_02655 [Thermoprotei archaeon]